MKQESLSRIFIADARATAAQKRPLRNLGGRMAMAEEGKADWEIILEKLL